MDESRLELKVGALALLAVAVLAGLVLALGRFSASDRFTFFADFAFAAGLPAGAVVKIAGVKVGRVQEVVFRPDARDEVSGRALPVRLRVEIDREAARALRADASATIGQQGALGESYLEVLPGESPRPLEERAAVRGLDPPRLDVVLARLSAVFDDAARDEAFRAFLVEVAKLAGHFNRTLATNGSEVGGMVEGVGALVSEGRVVMHEARVAVRGAAELLSRPDLHAAVTDVAETARFLRAELPGMVQEARAVLARLDRLTGTLSPEDVARLKGTLARVDKLAASAEAVLGRVERGEGTLGQLSKDPKVYEELRALLNDLKENPWKLVWKK